MKNAIIIVGLLLALPLAFCSISHAQTRVYGTKEGNIEKTIPAPDPSVQLIADETTLNYTKTEAKIHCSNESVFNDLFKTHGALFKRFTCTWETDRHGRYKDYIIYLAKGDAELIINWAKINL